MTLNSESKIEHITRKIDDLVQLVERLDAPSKDRPAESSGQNIQLNDAAKPSKHTHSSGPDFEGIDTSLLLHALQVAKLLKNAVDDGATGHESQPIAQLRSSSQILQAVLDPQRRVAGLNDGPPFARSLPPGMTLRDLPVPPLEKIMACLRMVQGTFMIKSTTRLQIS